METIIKIGRRKTSVARVFCGPAANAGKGKIVINKREFENFFPVEIQRIKMMEPFQIAGVSSTDYDINVNVRGGGITGQAEAIRLGLARVLIEIEPEHKSPLKLKKMLTRDSREVERKKPGQPKARKKTQFSKR